MTQKEIDKFLAYTKVYVNGQSWEIQEKLFSLGYAWSDGITAVCHTSEPFIYIWGDKRFCYGNDMKKFNSDSKREITAEKILSLELTESSYRPFKDTKECWQEMLKHEPFGWVKNKAPEYYASLAGVSPDRDFISAFDRYTFADGTPFGIKEEY